MTCSAEIKENQACIACKIKGIIKQDDLGGDYLNRHQVPQNKQIVTQPKDAWAGRPKREVVYCDRQLDIPVK